MSPPKPPDRGAGRRRASGHAKTVGSGEQGTVAALDSAELSQQIRSLSARLDELGRRQASDAEEHRALLKTLGAVMDLLAKLT